MATAAARVEDLQAGTVPGVCAKTGDLAQDVVAVEFTWTPGWTWILLPFGILPFLIARGFSRIRVRGLVPMSWVALRRGRTFNWVARGLLMGGLALLAASIAWRPAVAWSGLAVFLGGLVVRTVGWPLFWPTGRVEGEWVVLSFVHKRFARELEHFYETRAPAD